jgi:alkylation response protein AidB-like acyl-CoA dehydrogenase
MTIEPEELSGMWDAGIIAADNGVPLPAKRALEARLVAALAAALSALRQGAKSVPEELLVREHLAAIARTGLLAAPLPTAEGGLGWGTEPDRAASLCAALRMIGRASLALGRVFEGHVNAIRLLHRHASKELFADVARDARGGSLIGLWVTAFSDPVRLGEAAGGQVPMRGTLDVCSGAGLASRAVIMAIDSMGSERLAYLGADDFAVIADRRVTMTGMRAAMTGAVRVEAEIPAMAVFAGPGDYMTEPDFSAGAWRTSAVTVGGLEALVHEAMAQLRAKGRDEDVNQRARLGQMVMAREAARLWIAEAAQRAEAALADPDETRAFVNLARLAIEEACLVVIPLVQRSLGLSGLQHGNPAEQVMRDLSTYLRQPAGDEVLAVAAAFYLDRELGPDRTL